MKSPTIYLNRVVIPQLEHLRIREAEGFEKLTRVDDEGRILRAVWQHNTTQKNPAGFAMYANVLFSQAAEKLLLAPAQDEAVPDLHELPESTRSRIEPIDTRRRIYKSVKSLFLPIFQDAVALRKYSPPRWHSKDRSPWGPHNSRISGSPLVRLARETYLLALAAEHSAQVDLAVNEYKRLLSEVESWNLGNESMTRISLLRGLLAPYTEVAIDCYRLAPEYDGLSVGDRLRELMADAKIQDLSHERHLLGIPTKAAQVRRRLRTLIREIVSRHKYRNFLTATQEVATVATQGNPVTAALGFLTADTGYSPPLISLEAYKFPANQYREYDRDTLVNILEEDVVKEAEAAGCDLQVLYNEFTSEPLPDFTFGELYTGDDRAMDMPL